MTVIMVEVFCCNVHHLQWFSTSWDDPTLRKVGLTFFKATNIANKHIKRTFIWAILYITSPVWPLNSIHISPNAITTPTLFTLPFPRQSDLHPLWSPSLTRTPLGQLGWLRTRLPKAPDTSQALFTSSQDSLLAHSIDKPSLRSYAIQHK